MLRVHVTPVARIEDIETIAEDHADGIVWKLKVRAKPHAVKANAAAATRLAAHLGLAKSRISVQSGTGSRLKTLRIVGNPKAVIKLVSTKIETTLI
ncbi:MAG: DUF167 family protein [Pseudomonadota bacterium]